MATSNPPTLRTVRLSEIYANPFRDSRRHPLDEQKIESLVGSIRKGGGLWRNIEARERNGRYEIAYGHHRIEAARRALGKNAEIEVVVLDLSDEEMLLRLVEENRAEYATSALTEIENVRAIVLAFAENKISLPPPPVATFRRPIRVAPSFVPTVVPCARGEQLVRAFTAQSIAEYLGRLKKRGDAAEIITNAVAALELEEEGFLDLADLRGLGPKQIAAVVATARTSRSRATGRNTASKRDSKAPKAGKSGPRKHSKGHEPKAKSLTRAKSQAKTKIANTISAMKSGKLSTRAASVSRTGEVAPPPTQVSNHGGTSRPQSQDPTLVRGGAGALSDRVSAALLHCRALLTGDDPKWDESLLSAIHLDRDSRETLACALRGLEQRARQSADQVAQGFRCRHTFH